MSRTAIWRDPICLFLLASLSVMLLLASRGFVLQEDEVLIFRQALEPPMQVLQKFLGAGGQHVHPPLSDLLLGLWLDVSNRAADVLRLPNIAAFVAGVALIAATAARLMPAAPAAARVVCAAALLWPYGLHSGWMFGWYSIAFLEVAALTLAFVGYAERPTRGRLIALMLWSIALLWTNYFGAVLIGLLGLEYIRRRRQGALLPWSGLVAWATVTLLSFVPLFGALTTAWQERVAGQGRGLVSRLAYGGWNLWISVGGETIAPWSLPWSAIGLLGCATAVAIGLWRGRDTPRFALIGYGIALGILSVLGQSGAKRILFLTPWLLLGVATLWLQLEGKWRTWFRTGLVTTVAIGFAGLAVPRAYATLRFADPWPEVAAVAVAWIADGGVVMGTHPTLFHLVGRTVEDSLGDDALIAGAQVPGLIDAGAMTPPDLTGLARILVVNSAGFVSRQDRADPLFAGIRARCALRWERGFLPDQSSSFKNRFAAESSHLSHRITLSAFDCPAAVTSQ